MDGWIKLHRQITKWEWYDDANTFRLFLHCILMANHEDKQWHGITIPRGSFITSLAHLSRDLKLSVQQIRTSLEKLSKLTNELTIKTTNRYTTITIVKYNDYQSGEVKITNKITSNLTNKQQTNNKQITTTKNYKNDKNYKNIYIRFISEFNRIVKSEHRATDKNQKQFNARITEGWKLEQIVRAIEVASTDAFIMGRHRDNKKRYLTPEYILRPDKLDSWYNRKKPQELEVGTAHLQASDY